MKKATEILEQLKNVFLSEEEVVVQEKAEELSEVPADEAVLETQEEAVKEELSEEVVETNSEVDLAEDAVEETVEETTDEVVKVDFATKEDLSSLKSEMLEILSKLEEIRKDYKKDVPAELSEQKQELSEEVVEITHSPESEVEESNSFKFSARRIQTTQDRVFSKLFKK